MCCSRKLFKGNTYEITLPFYGGEVSALTVSFFTDGEVKVEKDLSEIELSGKSMTITLTPEDLQYLKDGVLRYEVVYGSDMYTTNTRYVVVTPAGYSAQTLSDLVESAYESGLTACSGSSCNLQEGRFVLMEDYQGQAEVIWPDIFHDGFSKFTVLDNGYGNEKYSEGYDVGYVDGVSSVHCSGYTQEDLDAAYASGWSAGYESGITDCSGQTPVYSGYLTFDILSSGTLSWYNAEEDFESDYSTCYLKYRVNGGEWETLVNNTVHETDAVSSITLNAGDMVEFKTDSLNYNILNSTSGTHYRFKSSETLRYNISGNIMSLIYPEDQFQTATTFPEALYGESDWFDQLFESEGLEGGPVDASNLVLPATDLTEKCYRHLFYRCTTLTAAPELPALNLATNCYSSMFSGCTGLTVAPVLPATTLAEYCYHFMFQGCTGLASAPELPATTLERGSYRGMFHGCTSLNYVKCLATDISADNCTNMWLANVSSSGTFVKNPNMASWTSGSNGIPTGWTVINNND